MLFLKLQTSLKWYTQDFSNHMVSRYEGCTLWKPHLLQITFLKLSILDDACSWQMWPPDGVAFKMRHRLGLKSHTLLSTCLFWINWSNYLATTKKYVQYSVNVYSIKVICCHCHVTYQHQLRRFSAIHRSSPMASWNGKMSIVCTLQNHTGSSNPGTLLWVN